MQASYHLQLMLNVNADLNGRNEHSHHFLAAERMAKNLPKSGAISWEFNSRNTIIKIVLDNSFSKNTVLVLGDTVRLSHDWLVGRKRGQVCWAV